MKQECTFVIRHRYTGRAIFVLKCESLSLCVQAAVIWGKNLEGADLRRANLEGADLEGADLRGADLRGADLEGADLRRADLRGADLEGADLRGADLRGANLRRADLRRANLRRANLEGANLEGANLEGANLEGANLEGANLDKSSGFSLSCKGLNVKIDDRLAVQMLFHVASCVSVSSAVSDELKSLLLSPDALKIINQFHRGDVPRLSG